MTPEEQDPAKGRAFELSFTAATAILIKAFSALQGLASDHARLAPIFENLEQTLSDFRQGYCQTEDDQHNPHLDAQLALLGDLIQMGHVAHPAATLEDAEDELRYMTSLMRAQKDSS